VNKTEKYINVLFLPGTNRLVGVEKMNKSKAIFTVLLALVSVLVLFSIVNTENQSTYAAAADGEPQVEENMNEPQNPVIESIIEAQFDQPQITIPTPRAQLENENYVRYSKTIKYNAFVMLGDAPVPGLVVTEYCNDEEVSTTETADNGWFKVIFNCRPGYQAWIEADYEGQKLKSDAVYIPQPIVKRSGSVQPASFDAAGVPEFSTGTLVLVVVAGTLGVALLRKQ